MRKQIKVGKDVFERILPSELKKDMVYYEAGRQKLIKLTVHNDPQEYPYDKSQIMWSVMYDGKEQFYNVLSKEALTPIQLYVMLVPDQKITDKSEEKEK